MVRKNKYIIILIAILLFSSCSNYKDTAVKELTTIHVQSKSSEKLRFNDVLTNLEFIPIEYDSTKLIGRITKVRYYNDRFYILDPFSSKSLSIVDTCGIMVNQISTIGRGPAEFLTPRDFFLDEFYDELVIVDYEQNKILKYDLDGNFKEDIFLSYNVFAADIVGKDHYAIKTFNLVPEIAIVNRKWKIIKRVHQWYNEFDINLDEPFSRYNGHLYYIEHLNDTVYKVLDNYCFPKLYFDFGAKKLSQRDYESLISESKKKQFAVLLPEDAIGGIIKISLSKGFKLIQYQVNRRLRRTLILDDQTFVNISYDDPFLKKVELIGTDDLGTIIGIIEAFDFYELINDVWFQKTYQKKLKNSSNGLNKLGVIEEYHNPILIKMNINY